MQSIRALGGEEPDVVLVGNAAGASSALEAALQGGARLVVVVGGDGSVRTAATSVAGSAAMLGIVPAGTGNVFAAALGLPNDPLAAARALAGARTRRVDVGEAETAAGTIGFAVACGTGFDARFLEATSPEAKARFGIAAYFAGAADAARRLRPARTRLVADGETYELTALATLAANAGQLLPGRVGPRVPIRPDDGLLDVIVLTGSSALDGTRAALGLLLGEPGRPPRAGPGLRGGLRILAREVAVETDPPEPVEVDGDLVDGASGWFRARLRPGALTVLVPKT